VNLACAEGHPSEVMDMSFANQFLGMIRMAREGRDMKAGVYDIPAEQDQELAATKLGTMGIAIDRLTDEQVAYANNYLEGT
jgi:adenosylhomocysteinase